MSKLFSIVELETDTGITDTGYVGGIPDRDDIMDTALYRELLEDCGGCECIKANVRSYIYGDGESENASDEDLEHIRAQEDFCERDEVDLIQSENYEFLIDDGMTMGM